MYNVLFIILTSRSFVGSKTLFFLVYIDRVSEQKYRGVLLDDKLNFKPQHSLLINKLTDTLRALRIIKNHVPTEALIQFFNAHFMIHLYYCAFIYAKLTKDEIKRIQVLQNRCIKAIFKLDSRHDSVDLYKSFMTKRYQQKASFTLH